MYAILIGAPGAGKGTQAFILQTAHGFVHLASGDLLRAAIREGSALGRQVKAIMDRGELVPDELVIRLILDRLPRLGRQRGVILDGFPRTLEQARAFDAALAERGERVTRVIYLDAPAPILLERLTKRYQCSAPECGAIYNWGVNPPRQPGLCDRCGAGLYQRLDDNAATVARRLEAYFNQTLPLIRHYEASGRLSRIEGDQPIERVTEQILATLSGARGETKGLAAG